ncbi:MAG: hypothetical protein AB1705_24215 [Verrucomicrobiota bacterium]
MKLSYQSVGREPASADQPGTLVPVTPLSGVMFLAVTIALLGSFGLTLRAYYAAVQPGAWDPLLTAGPATRELAFEKPAPKWGNLSYTRITIERPDAFISTDLLAYEETRWFFGSQSRAQVVHILRDAPFTTAQRLTLLDPSRWEVTSNGVFVTPGMEVIFGMSREARQRVYPTLAAYPENLIHHHPFHFRADGLEEWFDQSGLSERTEQLVKGLLYQRGNTLCFSDLWEVATQIPETHEKMRLLKTLGRHSTLLVKLRVKPDSDIEALTRYWGKSGRAKDIRPLLASLTQVPGGTTVDICHLLPPFARKRLYTYPTDIPDAPRRDCHWTAMNFFNDLPDDRFLDFAEVTKAIQQDYYPVQDEMTLGDVIFFVKPEEGIVHAAVYIAEDMVFTKNGAHPMQPWTIMPIEDVRAAYPSDQPLEQAAFRLKRL